MTQIEKVLMFIFTKEDDVHHRESQGEIWILILMTLMLRKNFMIEIITKLKHFVMK